jgi:thioredoxin-related protein
MKVIKIGAVWCSGCLVMRPRWEEIEKENTWLKTEYFDFDNDNKLIKKYKVESGRLPVFIFLDKRGGEILRISGEVEKKKLLEVINENKNL